MFFMFMYIMQCGTWSDVIVNYNRFRAASLRSQKCVLP